MKNWENLRFYLAVARNKTVVAAAEQFGVSHSTVIRRISELEDELNCKLFKRSQRGYELTKSGDKLFENIVSIEEKVTEIERIAKGDSEEIKGRLTISCLENDMVDLFPVISSFIRQYPSIDIEMNTTFRSVDLAKKNVDVAIRMTNSPPENLVGRCVGRVSWGVFASKEYLNRVQERHDLSQLDWVIWQQKEFIVGKSWLDKNVKNLKPILNTNNPSEVINAVKFGLGVGILNQNIANKDPCLECIVADIRRFDLWVLTHPDSKDVARVQTFMKFMAEHYSS